MTDNNQPIKSVKNKNRIEKICLEKGLKMTEQRRIIARVLSQSLDHPDVEILYNRASNIDQGISIATVYRTVRLFEESGILTRHDFGDGRARYEEISEDHHDHLINIENGEIIEFQNQEIEKLQEEIANRLGFKLMDHRLELYGVPLESARVHTQLFLPFNLTSYPKSNYFDPKIIPKIIR